MHEQNQVLRIYEALRIHGFPYYSISLETQFKFAGGATKNSKKRPDICVFNPPINGIFNLYKQGNGNQSGDSLKIDKLQSLIEVKVAPDLTEATLDIEKLCKWREKIEAVAICEGIIYRDDIRYQFIASNVKADVAEVIHRLGKRLEIDVRII